MTSSVRSVPEPSVDDRTAARFLGMTGRNAHKTIQNMARKGSIPARKYAGHWFFLISELDGWRKNPVAFNSPSVPHSREGEGDE